MAYYFMARNGNEENRRANYSYIDITKSKYFEKKSDLKKEGACTLEEIDNFTMKFEDKQDLLLKLANEDAVDISLLNKPLSIRCSGKGRVDYDFLYSKDRKYIDDPRLIISYMDRALANEDFAFIKKFAEHFSNVFDCRFLTAEIIGQASESMRYGFVSSLFNEIDSYGDNPVCKLCRKLIYKMKKNEQEFWEYSNEINYRNLHDIVSFIRHYKDAKLKAIDLEKERLEREKEFILKFGASLSEDSIYSEDENGQFCLFDDDLDPDRFIFEDDAVLPQGHEEDNTIDKKIKRKYLHN